MFLDQKKWNFDRSLTMKRLLNLGFIKVGQWTVQENHIQFHLDLHQKTRNVLYSFVSNGTIMYIGKTTTSLTKRMYGYQNPGTSQRTNIRVKKEMETFLTNNPPIDIFVLVDNRLLKHGDYRINLAAGLEDTLLLDINPDWNYAGKNKPKKHKENQKERLYKIINPMTLKSSSTDTFEITLGQAYYNQGFFNIGVKHSDKIGSANEEIIVQLGANPKDIIRGYINRTANTNKTPRIMCGKQYTVWIKNNFRQKDTLTIDIISETFLRLNEKIRTPNKRV